jgi:large subunit ribosomal protein L29
MSDDELKSAETRVREELFRLRFQQHTAQLSNTSQLREAKHELARILTTLTERAKGISAAPKTLAEQGE